MNYLRISSVASFDTSSNEFGCAGGDAGAPGKDQTGVWLLAPEFYKLSMHGIKKIFLEADKPLFGRRRTSDA